MGWRFAIVLALAPLGGCNLSPFVCSDDSSCSQRGQGRCEGNGACSYPDSNCESGRRYSAYGPADEGRCVPDDDSNTTTTGGGSTDTSSGEATTLDPSAATTTGDTESSSSGGEPDACGGCSGRGSCVVVDGDPTCACDPGWTMVDLECLEDPCATQACYFVDSDEGNDDGPGTRDQPWQTRDRAVAFLSQAAPGDHVLFRRGRTFGGGTLGSITAQGTSAAPVVIGAYGPPQDAAAPIFTECSMQFSGAEHVVLRDVAIRGNGGSPCVFLRNSGYVTVRDAELSECGIRGIRISDQTHHSVVFRNDIHDVGDKVGIYIADTAWTTPTPTFVGEHHWVAGNTVRNNEESGIHGVFIPSNHEAGDVGDLKIVDNQLTKTGAAGITIRAPAAWVLDNIIVGSTPAPADYSSAIVVNGSDAWTHIRGNIVAGTDGALLMLGAGLVENNSFFHGEGATSTVVFGSSQDEGSTFVDNLVFSDQAVHASGGAGDLSALFTIDRNVYAATSEGACTFEVGNTSAVFSEWQNATGDEADSRCEVVPGLTAPSADSVPVDDRFIPGLAPGSRWQGCDSVGAVACDGQRRLLRFEPSDDVDENAGRGWEGPLIIQQHYPLDR